MEIYFFSNFSTVFDLVAVHIPINYSVLEKLRAIIDFLILLLQPQTTTRT